jgi:hypothetical protein
MISTAMMSGIGKVGDVFETFVFEPDLNSLGAKNETGRAARPTSWGARSQDVEVKFMVLTGFRMLSIRRAAHLSFEIRPLFSATQLLRTDPQQMLDFLIMCSIHANKRLLRIIRVSNKSSACEQQILERRQSQKRPKETIPNHDLRVLP